MSFLTDLAGNAAGVMNNLKGHAKVGFDRGLKGGVSAGRPRLSHLKGNLNAGRLVSSVKDGLTGIRPPRRRSPIGLDVGPSG